MSRNESKRSKGVTAQSADLSWVTVLAVGAAADGLGVRDLALGVVATGREPLLVCTRCLLLAAGFKVSKMCPRTGAGVGDRTTRGCREFGSISDFSSLESNLFPKFRKLSKS